jgi:ribosome biogenesis protein BRX1
MGEPRWKNRQRTLVVCSRGVSHQHRHLMNDLLRLLPHSKKESKVEKDTQIQALHDLADMRSCNNCIYLEHRKRFVYLWIFHYPNGPSVKFLLHNIHTTHELKLTGNSLKGSRPILSFDSSFEESAHTKLLKQMFTQTFSTPRYHPKSTAFIDHVFSFSHIGGEIYFRNFQIVQESKDINMMEIGPRFQLTPIKIFDKPLCGDTLFSNASFVNPNRLMQKRKRSAYEERLEKKLRREENAVEYKPEGPTHEEIFG